MHFFRRTFALFMAMVLCFSLLPSFPAAALEDNGIIRVLLTKLQLTDQLKVTLDGSYTLNDMAFQRGSQLIFSCADGPIMLYYEGLSFDCGEQVILTRHETATGTENGFRANGAYYLHPGDLHLSVLDGQLRPVLHAPIEEYLLGVVPYEMSDSFPLEALKVQSIAARTYALRKKQASTGDYDVVDNTNDQAYFGIQWENKNAIEAVKSTAGICGFYKNRLAECFYSASNGGQTELVNHVWGSGDYGYLTMTDDPYDLENPASVVKRFTLPKQMSASEHPNELHPVLALALSEQMEALGFDGAAENIRITAVERLTLSDPLFSDSPSRIMTKAVFEVKAAGKKPALQSYGEEEDISIFTTPQPTEDTVDAFIPVQETLTAELDVFQELIPACRLDINAGTDNELLSVTETEHAFILESRRYGHGVGMSQRGAECMARDYGWNHEQILRFYYPGVSLGTVTYTHTIPTPLPYAFMATPGPAASPTPRPTLMPATSTLQEGEYKVVVNQIAENSYLNLRNEPSTSSSVIRQLYYGQELIVTSSQGDWLQVKTDAVQGYVMAEFVEKVE